MHYYDLGYWSDYPDSPFEVSLLASNAAAFEVYRANLKRDTV
jgi:hypothetical protein